jgi:hypothetical protein
MVRIAISQAAFEAIARTLPFGSVDRLKSLRGRGESYSDVILRLAARAERLAG